MVVTRTPAHYYCRVGFSAKKLRPFVILADRRGGGMFCCISAFESGDSTGFVACFMSAVRLQCLRKRTVAHVGKGHARSNLFGGGGGGGQAFFPGCTTTVACCFVEHVCWLSAAIPVERVVAHKGMVPSLGRAPSLKMSSD